MKRIAWSRLAKLITAIVLAESEKTRVADLRAAPRTIGGIPGEELVTRFAEKNDAVVHTFWWEVNGTEDDVLLPHLSLTMDPGTSNNGPVPSSLSQEAGIALRDKISSRIRFHHPPPVPSIRLPPPARPGA